MSLIHIWDISWLSLRPFSKSLVQVSGSVRGPMTSDSSLNRVCLSADAAAASVDGTRRTSRVSVSVGAPSDDSSATSLVSMFGLPVVCRTRSVSRSAVVMSSDVVSRDLSSS